MYNGLLYILHVLDPFIGQWTFRFFPFQALGVVNDVTMNMGIPTRYTAFKTESRYSDNLRLPSAT